MALRFCLLVCLTGCGLTLDLDEPVDASVPDAAVGDSAADAFDGGLDARPLDALVVDAGAPDVGEDSAVMRFDGGFDAPPGCPPSCPPDTYCDDVRCVPYCIGDGDCGVGRICYAESGICAEPACVEDDECVDLEGQGCTVPRCESGRCDFPLVEFNEVCQDCDPRSGEIFSYDEDNDGFPPCVPECTDGPGSCDCDDTDAFINPETLRQFGPGADIEGICSGTVPLPAGLFCVIDQDEDGAPVFRPTFGGSTCESDIVLELEELRDELRRRGGPDCDDDDMVVHPMQAMYMEEPRSECELPRPCFDYNCDRRQEREYPAFEHCGRAFDEDECAGASGWRRRGSGDAVPPCGGMGELTTCRWSALDGCIVAATTEAIQGCR
ncbi:MAG: hypothetical protein AB8H86_02525 [Polyangiales bacterium]